MRLSLVQYQVGRAASLTEFVKQFRIHIEQSAGSGAELVCFPEYVCVDLLPEVLRRNKGTKDLNVRGLLRQLPCLNEEVFPELSALSKTYGIALAAGTFLTGPEGGPWQNTAQIFLPSGERLEQPKLHVAYELIHNAEDISPGDTLRLFQVGEATVGLLICYDAQFPESARAVLETARPDLILVPGCALEPWGIGRLRTATAARAMESLCFAASPQIVGTLDLPVWRQEFWGQSLICGPISKPFPLDGILKSAVSSAAEILSVHLDVELLRHTWKDGFPRPEDRHVSFTVDPRRPR